MPNVTFVDKEKNILDENSLTFEERQKELDVLKYTENENNEREKKNRDFIQLYREHMSEIRWLMINHPFASSVLFYILEKMDGKNVLACSFKVLEEYFNKSTSTLQRAVKILKDNGFLTIAKIGTSNVYIVNTEVAWTSYGNQKNGSDALYAEFDGKILLSKKENIHFNQASTISIRTTDSLNKK